MYKCMPKWVYATEKLQLSYFVPENLDAPNRIRAT